MPKPRQRRIGQVISASGGTLTALVDHAKRLSELDRALAPLLGAELACHCRVADFRGGRLVVMADSAAWATRLRYHTPQIRGRLAEAGMTVNDLRFIVRPVTASVAGPDRRRAPPSLSPDAAHTLESGADAISDGPLSDALRRLAANGKPG
jgi:hypothetical protein